MVKEQIGFIGTGAMGGGMATSLLREKFPVVVFDVNPNALPALRERGAVALDSARAVADAAAIVFACLPAPDVSREVAGEVAQGSAVEIYIESSTIGSTTMNDVAARLAGSDITLLDAPISGGSKGAYDGVLSTIISGSQDAFDRTRSAFEAFAKYIFFLGGEPGQAQIAKLINNMLSMASRALTFEGATLALEVGLDPKVLADFISVSTGRNMATMDAFPSRVLNIFHSGPKKSIGIKDLELYVEEANRLGAPLLAAPGILDLFLDGAEYGNDDSKQLPYSGYVKQLRELLSRQNADSPKAEA
jgi:3-hydroxyisobutyrate dehydrogenase-like beta-hydroxyacid dehydrogenase